MMHDFALTEKDVVLFDLPVTLSLDAAKAGKEMPYVESSAQSGRGLARPQRSFRGSALVCRKTLLSFFMRSMPMTMASPSGLAVCLADLDWTAVAAHVSVEGWKSVGARLLPQLAFLTAA